MASSWRAVEPSRYENSPKLYKENGFKQREDAQELIRTLSQNGLPCEGIVQSIEKKKENKNPPLLFNLAELQNVCSKLFKISPDQTLKIVQELYEKKLVTYPRTDARVLSTAVCKEIHRNLNGLRNYPLVQPIATKILQEESYKNIAKTRYCNDKQITDHYAIIPTGQGFGALRSVSPTGQQVYEVIVRRFLCIFYPPAQYQKINLVIAQDNERFFSNFKVMLQAGYLEIATASFAHRKDEKPEGQDADQPMTDQSIVEVIRQLKKGTMVSLDKLEIKEGETSPPKRYNSGSMILAMENAGQLIEDEELRSQIKGSGIGTSATRAEILSKLVKIKYLKLNKKTQIITPELLGEMVYDVVDSSIRSLLNPELTASWEKGLTYVAEGTISEAEYMKKLEDFVVRRVDGVKQINNAYLLRNKFDAAAVYYKTRKG